MWGTVLGNTPKLFWPDDKKLLNMQHMQQKYYWWFYDFTSYGHFNVYNAIHFQNY